MLDMDDLKFSNDVYGSGAGNSVLETAVSTIRRGLSEKDRLIRYDGGRLLLLLPDIRQEQLSPRLEQIRLQLQAASVPATPASACQPALEACGSTTKMWTMRCSTRNG